eukprot:CAMPEP_0202051050 /NCGR_PEP_ID=MMETSP0963-20130614/4387_1 /ASSEMBLY_ACC=CAM_ASM_000494 /TAXON_ID=4773 /ORGANISM="Schizochytrium aggregatum, Strain ATCC28209" /LENGTH=83 /DNA_ID=CAMNT_0048616189 /DNA_START=104 /DNA_END=355 /DNA_ORIENTATION=-
MTLPLRPELCGALSGAWGRPKRCPAIALAWRGRAPEIHGRTSAGSVEVRSENRTGAHWAEHVLEPQRASKAGVRSLRRLALRP